MSDQPYYLKWIPPGKQSWQVGSAIIVVPEGESIISCVRCRSRRVAERRYFMLVKGKPFAQIVQICPTCSGILQMGYAGKAEIDPWLADIREAAQDGRTCKEKIDAFRPIVALFGRCVYWLGIVEHSLTGADGRPWLSEFGNPRDPSGLATGHGGYGPRFLEPVQPGSRIDHSVVQDHMDMIAKGGRPVGIAYYYDGFLSFLLDGHHKAMAYSAHGLDMPCLTICPMALVTPAAGSDEKVYWADRDSPIFDDDSRIVREEELPPAFMEKVRAKRISRRSRRPVCLNEETEVQYLRRLGVSR